MAASVTPAAVTLGAQRPLATGLVILAAIALVMGGAAAPASAASGIQVSRDGVNYSSVISGTLFNKITVSVPGDVQSTDLYVRNSSSVAGYLRISLSSVTVSDPVLATALIVTAGSPAFPGTPVAIGDAHPCYVLTEGNLVPPGGVVKVSSKLEFSDQPGSAGKQGSAGFSFRISLSDAAVGSLPPTECGSGTNIPAASGGGRIPLAMTGAEPPFALIIGAASVVGVGLFLVVAARRRREAKE